MNYLVIYASKYGITEKAVEILRRKILEAGNHKVTTVNIKKCNVPKLDSFDFVVLGSSIYIGNINKRLKQYIEDNRVVLLNKRTGVFICGSAPTPEAVEKEMKLSIEKKVLENAEARSFFGFGYKGEGMGFIDKETIEKEARITINEETIKKEARTPVNEEDLDKDAIAEFVKIIVTKK